MPSRSSSPATPPSQWLRRYYFMRAIVSIGWIASAVAVGGRSPLLGAVLFVAYPTWDALANLIDARRSGGLRANPTQAVNLAISVITAAGVAVALTIGMPAVIQVFGAWAILSGLLQLATAIRRWKVAGAQWVMVLSGAQSVLAGAFFFKRVAAGVPLDVTAVAPYAAFGAFYFLVSAIWLTVRAAPRSPAPVAG
ncbi:DUF308 domain-containing protein [Phenylobacterium deserti]|uniref:DUF308 domain-containing protein n=1 Tax=Phenylobacterium deserti TaxID=1914756 RepID=A0A328AC37_9CAUL|nr:DUF308 domain-containing protein [Phenylobacterium deserti]RAK52210.1 DUF308 domain-containing protein [Phenylobacterium deserti]